MKNIAWISSILFISQVSYAELDATKKSEYQTSCQRAALTFYMDSKQFSDNNKTILAAIYSCKEIMADLDANNKWSLVKDPKMDGCVDAIRLLLPKGTSEKEEKSQRAKYCTKYL